ncbi:MAG TPA: hypothetical protein VF647_13810 [Longimicrobium sp.]|jgi:hypothetical protein
MSAHVMVPLSGRAQKGAAPGPLRPVDAESLVVGKDIVELLSTAMYVDPLSVYREYVQNSADSIDAAVRRGVLQEGEGRIEILLDPVERSARVRDNGLGVPARAAMWARQADVTLLQPGASRQICAKGRSRTFAKGQGGARTGTRSRSR